MKTPLGDFTSIVCPKCGEERLKTALYYPDDENSDIILVCQNCHYREFQ